MQMAQVILLSTMESDRSRSFRSNSDADRSSGWAAVAAADVAAALRRAKRSGLSCDVIVAVIVATHQSAARVGVGMGREVNVLGVFRATGGSVPERPYRFRTAAPGGGHRKQLNDLGAAVATGDGERCVAILRRWRPVEEVSASRERLKCS